jgi:stress-induced morphogen
MSDKLRMAPVSGPIDPTQAIQHAVEAAISDSRAEVGGARGHFTIDVVSPAFEGKSRLEQQRMVLRAIKHLMDGPDAPVHAVDRVTTRVA